MDDQADGELVSVLQELYIVCMARKLSTTVRLDPDDADALARARSDGVSSSELIRRGLRLVAAKYYRGKRRPPTTGLFISTDPRLGDEAELFGDSRRSLVRAKR
jgi:hypothetical protein